MGQDLAGAATRVAGLAGNNDFVGAVDPQTVDEVCFEGGGAFLFIRRTSPTTADAISGTGPCPATFPTTGFRSYER